MSFEEKFYLILIGSLINGLIIFVLQNILKKKISEDIKSLENKLDTELMKNTTKFHNIHEAQVNILQSIYKMILDVREMMTVLIMPVPMIINEEGIEIFYPKIYEIVFKFKYYYTYNKVSLPGELISIIDEIELVFDRIRIQLNALSYAKKNKGKYNITEETIEKEYDNFSKEVDYFVDSYPPLLADFEKYYRSTLGINLTSDQ